MKTVKTMIAIITLTFSAQSFATQCWVIGQDPKNMNDYNQLLKYVPASDFDQSPILFQNGQLMVSKTVGSDGRLAVATSKSSSQFLSAAAVGSVDDVQLIDGNLKVSILCTK